MEVNKYMRKLTCSILLTGILLFSLVACNTDTSKTNPDPSKETDGAEQVEPVIEKPKDIIVSDIEGLLAGKQDTIVKYFGESDIYTAESVKDRVSVAKVTFVSASSVGNMTLSYSVQTEESGTIEEATKETSNGIEEKSETSTGLDEYAGILNGDIEVKLHICTMDYLKTKDAVDSLNTRMKSENPTMEKEEMNTKITAEIASRAQNGEFEAHITIPVIVHYVNGEGSIVLTEELKLALTGGWYNPTQAKIVSGECPIRVEAQKQLDQQTTDTQKIPNIKDNNSGRADSRDTVKKAT